MPEIDLNAESDLLEEQLRQERINDAIMHLTELKKVYHNNIESTLKEFNEKDRVIIRSSVYGR